MKIELKKWSLADKEGLMFLCNEVDRRYLAGRLPFPYTVDHANWWLNMVNEHEGVDGIYRSIWVDDHLVGNISIEQKHDIFCKDGEIGYLLLTPYWSKGIMSEAVKQICEIGFHDLDIVRITGKVFQPNVGSCKVLEKNHFVLEGVMKYAVSKDDVVYDLCIYGKYKEFL